MVTNPSGSGFNADASQGVSFHPVELIDDLEEFLAGERASDEAWSSPSPHPRDVSSVQISSFRDRFEKLPDRTLTVVEWLAAIRDGSAAEPIARIRAARGSPDYDRLKRGLRCISWAGQFPSGRKHADPCEPSGLVFLELDHHDGAPDPGWLWSERMRLSANPSTVSVYTSAGGQGLHIIVAVNPIPCTRNEYRRAWSWVNRELGIEASGDSQVGHHNRLAAVSHDARIYTNLAPTPIPWEPNTWWRLRRQVWTGGHPRDLGGGVQVDCRALRR